MRRIRVDGRALYAKYSLLGVSLVSLLRGACGPWPQVREAQRAYVLRPDALIEREAGQLRFLQEAGHPAFARWPACGGACSSPSPCPA